jgi:hypothetical protein
MYKYPPNKAAEYTKKYPTLTKYLKNNIANDVMSSSIITNALIQYAGFKGEITVIKPSITLTIIKLKKQLHGIVAPILK